MGVSPFISWIFVLCCVSSVFPFIDVVASNSVDQFDNYLSWNSGVNCHCSQSIIDKKLCIKFRPTANTDDSCILTSYGVFCVFSFTCVMYAMLQSGRLCVLFS